MKSIREELVLVAVAASAVVASAAFADQAERLLVLAGIAVVGALKVYSAGEKA